MRKSRAITLIELMIASSIFVVVMVGIYSAFSGGIFGYRDIGQTIDTYQAARLILERINLDLRNSFRYSPDEARFIGSKNELSFLTLTDTFKDGTMNAEYAQVSYKQEEDKLLRLCRKNQDALNTKSDTKPEEMGSTLSIEFAYGFKATENPEVQFQEAWGGSSGQSDESKNFPCAVKVALTLKGEKGKTFERIIYF